MALLFCISFISNAQEHNIKRNVAKSIRKAASNPTPLVSGVSVSIFKYLGSNLVRLIYDKTNNFIYVATVEGDIYKLPILSGGSAGVESILISSSEHNINYLQGLEYHNNTFYLVGNENNPSSFNGRGRVKRCVINSDNSHTWSDVATTELYPSSGTLFDHAFAGVALSKNKDTLFVSSGSRTDHGEVKNSGSYTGLREVPLTAKIFAFPINTTNVILQNNQAFINSSGYLYADGTRNEFDMAVNGKGHLIGLENSGDRDDPEELNWLRKGKHYGFPWRMGGNDTPMQYVPYDASNDKLIPAYSLSTGIFQNDPAYPPRPSGVVFEEPIKNYGPDANWIRNPSTGLIYRASEVTTFTSHRSPLGLVFDNDSTMAIPYLGDGFMFAYSNKDDPFSEYLPAEDGGGDMCHLKLNFNQTTGSYTLNTTRLISGFGNISDATIDGNTIYISELQGVIWKITMPVLQSPIANFSFQNDNDCAGQVLFHNSSVGGASYNWDFGDGYFSSSASPTHRYSNSGNYSVTLTTTNLAGNHQKTINIGYVSPNINHTGSGIAGREYKSNGIITSSANVSTSTIYNALKSIILLPGFQAGTNEVFETKIEGCD